MNKRPERAKAYSPRPLGDVGDACGAKWSKSALGMNTSSNHALQGQQNNKDEHLLPL
jgi:hypothetical protein